LQSIDWRNCWVKQYYDVIKLKNELVAQGLGSDRGRVEVPQQLDNSMLGTFEVPN
jgi:hypothetical protein